MATLRVGNPPTHFSRLSATRLGRTGLWLFCLYLFLSAAAWSQPVSGQVEIPGYAPLKLVDGWLAPDCSPRFLNIYLVPYANPKHILDSGRPWVQICAWFPDQPTLPTIKMASLNLCGLKKQTEFRYSFNDADSARQFFSGLSVTKKQWTISTSMANLKSPYPGVPKASWNFQATVSK